MRDVIRRRLAGEEGISLVEVVVAMAVLAVIFAGFAATLISSLHALLANESRARANALVNEILEDLQTTPWEDLEVGTETEDFERDGVDYEATTVTAWVNDPETADTEDYYDFTVTVTWSDLGIDRQATHDGRRSPPADEVEAGPTVRSVATDPTLGYLNRIPADADAHGRLERSVGFDEDGEIETEGTNAVGITVVTTEPVNTVTLTFEESDGSTESMEFYSPSGDGIEWEPTSSTQQWQYVNGQTKFSFAITSDEGPFTAHRVVRYVFETIEPAGGLAADPGHVCVDADWVGLHDTEVSAMWWGLTVDDTVEVVGSDLDPGQEWFAAFAGAGPDGSTFAFDLPADGHQFDETETTTTVSMTGARAFDGQSGTAGIDLDLIDPDHEDHDSLCGGP